MNTPRPFALLQGQIILMARKYSFWGCIRSLGNTSVRRGEQFHAFGKWRIVGRWPNPHLSITLSATNYCRTRQYVSSIFLLWLSAGFLSF